AVKAESLATGVFSRELLADFAGNGFAGALIPEQYGGSNMGMMALALACERMAAYGTGSAIFMLTMMDSLSIVRWGSDRAKERYLPAIAAGEMTMAFAIT